MDGSQILAWIENQNWFIIAFISVGALNIAIAGLKALGLTYFADECQKIENAIQAMVLAAKTSFLSLTWKKRV